MKAILSTLAIAAVTALAVYQIYDPSEVANEITFVKDLDIEKFMGRWYVIASKPNIIEKNCKCARSDDTLVDAKTIELAETCWIFGRKVTSKSKAVIEEPKTGHWTNWVSFIKADYWVIDIERNNYSWSVIGQPSKKGYWVMSRQPTLDSAKVDELLAKARTLGFDLSDLEYSDQTCKD